MDSICGTLDVAESRKIRAKFASIDSARRSGGFGLCTTRTEADAPMHPRPDGSLSIRTLLRSVRKSGARERRACHWTPLRIDGGPVKALRIGASGGSLRLPGAKRSALSCPRLDAEHVASQDPRPVAQARPRAPCLRCRVRSTGRPGRHPLGARRPQELTSDMIRPGHDLVHRGAGRDDPDRR